MKVQSRANKRMSTLSLRVFMSLLPLLTAMIDELLLADRRQINHWLLLKLTCDTLFLHLFASTSKDCIVSSSSHRSSICKESVADIFRFCRHNFGFPLIASITRNCAPFRVSWFFVLFLSRHFSIAFSAWAALLHCRLMDGAVALSVCLCECQLWWWCPILVHFFVWTHINK